MNDLKQSADRQQIMRMSVATNFDDSLLDRIAQYPVEDIYGKLSHDAVGGGRATFTTQGIGPGKLKAHVAHAHRLGIKFNYLLNSVCMGNREWTPGGMRQIRKLLDWLSKIGVDSVTVSTPYLAEIVKKRYTGLSLKIGIYANIDSPDRARFWEGMGAEMLVLESFSINRNFAALKAIRKAVSCRLQLITNFTCLSRCPMQIYHMTGLSHGSSSRDKAAFVDYCVFHCTYKLLKEPRQLIKSQWIRPEDISHYENIGYHDFKLLERSAPTDLMVARVDSYAGGTSPENLLDLIQPFGFKNEVKKQFGWQLKYLMSFLGGPVRYSDIARLLKKRGLMHSLEGVPVKLDSKKIPDDFLSRISQAPCATSGDCSECGYCGSIADAAYTAEEPYREECLELYEKVFDQLCSR